MKRRNVVIIFILLVVLTLLVLTICRQKTNEQDTNYVVMLSMDGFRWDYTDKVPTPNFDRIAKKGVKAKSLKASFPTKTFPNHYSIATGLYPDHHGIVLNSFYDPESNRYYQISDRNAVEDGSFYGGEPIWVTAEKQGVSSASFFWVGSEAEIGGYRPGMWKKYDHGFPYSQRIDTVVAWLNKPLNERPRLLLWYLDEPDHSGHKFGPDDPGLERKIAELDSLLGIFLDKIEKLSFADKINIIVTSDHGMGNISNDRKVALKNHIKEEWTSEIQGYNPNFNIKAREGFIDSLYFALKDVEGLTVWLSGEVPQRLSYGSNERTLDLVVVADSSWSVVVDPDEKVGKGAHGFDNDNRDMHAIFYAYGPAFKQNYVSSTFNNVDIYPLICKILDLKPAQVDGDIENVVGMLIEN